MDALTAAEKDFRKHLRPPPAGRSNFFSQAEIFLARIAASADEKEARRRAAEFGGLVKRWRAFLIERLTQAVLEATEADCSRQWAREWQRRVFGRSIASKSLSQFGHPDRSGGGRRDESEIPTGVEARAAAIYERFAPALRDATLRPI